VDAVITMLPTGAHAREVYAGPGGVLEAAAPGTLLLDCSTIAVEDARWLAETGARRGFTLLDAPVSGGVAAAAGGTLTFMVGGPESAFEAARAVLAPMARAVFHAGGPGAGQAAKICNNMLLAISMAGTCEAFVLAERLGLEARRFFEIASVSSGQCWSLTSYAPVAGLVPTAPAGRDFQGGFAGALMLKDLRLALDAAGAAGARTDMALKAEQLYSEYVGNYNPARDFSGLIDLIKQS
jgi:3-hydroxyisobutyrate dehydrogenase